MASNPSPRIPTSAQVAPRRSHRAAPPRPAGASLKVAPTKQTRTKERIWPALTIVSSIAIMIAFVVAGLFASAIQTQVEIDGINREIAELRETRVDILAERAWHDSPEGLAGTATGAGLVPATDVTPLTPVATGFLAPPTETDPFTPAAVTQR